MKYILTTVLVLFVFTLYSQVVVNEACPRNGFGITDEDGDAEDWIELYNSSVSTVDLNGYYLSDDIGNLTKWVFPSAVIEAGSYLTVFASGKDRTDIINHWETVVYATDMWKYIVPSAPVDPLWSTIWFDASSWNDGSGGIGYGDGDDITILSPPVKSVFMRREFNIVDTSLIGNAMFHMDFDDGFVAYLNGVEIARRNVGITYVPTSWDELAYEEHEAQLYQGQAMAEWLYFEQDVKTVLKNGPNVLAVQVHNVDSFSSDMTALPYLTVAIK
ncbi:MAG: lamin tail domain-containing protein, partial [Bacteroidota bacterium]